MEKFITKTETIGELLKNNLIRFVIPTYQRPFVWEDEEILKLLQDIHNAFLFHEPIYFIGNVYVTKTGENTYDIIDGQQRFTTLWLTALAFKKTGIQIPFVSFLGVERNLRLNFTIRKEVEQYLNSLFIGNTEWFDEYEIEQNDFLKYIAKGTETILGFLNNIQKSDLEGLGNYFHNNVTFVYNIAPKKTDLNNLFTALGNSGVQLEQTDILKSLLLKNVDNKLLYSKIWEACENMNDYFENNVLFVFSSTDKNNIEEHSFEAFNEEVFDFEDRSTIEFVRTKRSISEIIQQDISVKTNDNKKDSSKIRCRSIIPFSLLLLHTYRIFRKQNDDNDFDLSFDKKNLLAIFQELLKTPNHIPSFLKLLWRVRFAFDKYIVKWREDNESDESYDEDEKLRLTSLFKNENIFIRQNRQHSEMSMLQSVLYYTNGYNQQYWLTPFLYFALNTNNDEKLDAELEKIDNLMLPGQKKDISWRLMTKGEKDIKIENVKIKIGKNLGVGFNHYWFYKLEYLLWKSWDDRGNSKFKNYRITSKNSIEHVYPQHPEYRPVLREEALNNFGNLGLLSVGQNSSYSHQEVEKKKIDFYHKRSYDSLKLAKIYSSENIDNWNETEIQHHEDDMLSILENHYSNV